MLSPWRIRVIAIGVTFPYPSLAIMYKHFAALIYSYLSSYFNGFSLRLGVCSIFTVPLSFNSPISVVGHNMLILPHWICFMRL